MHQIFENEVDDGLPDLGSHRLVREHLLQLKNDSDDPQLVG